MATGGTADDEDLVVFGEQNGLMMLAWARQRVGGRGERIVSRIIDLGRPELARTARTARDQYFAGQQRCRRMSGTSSCEPRRRCNSVGPRVVDIDGLQNVRAIEPAGDEHLAVVQQRSGVTGPRGAQGRAGQTKDASDLVVHLD